MYIEANESYEEALDTVEELLQKVCAMVREVRDMYATHLKVKKNRSCIILKKHFLEISLFFSDRFLILFNIF